MVDTYDLKEKIIDIKLEEILESGSLVAEEVMKVSIDGKFYYLSLQAKTEVERIIMSEALELLKKSAIESQGHEMISKIHLTTVLKKKNRIPKPNIQNIIGGLLIAAVAGNAVRVLTPFDKLESNLAILIITALIGLLLFNWNKK